MAIDTNSLTQLITEFRALKAKDSITPESLGYILQRIADLLATAGTSDTMTAIQNLLNGFKAAGQAVASLQQGAADRNHILAIIRTVNLGTGAVNNSNGHIFIHQATTERAGAMRAQQVVDLNNTRRGLADAEKLLKQIEDKLGLNGSKGLYNAAQIAVITEFLSSQPNVEVRYTFTYFSEEKSVINRYLIAAYLKYGPDKAAQIFNQWYEIGRDVGENFFAPYNLDIHNSSVDEEFERQKLWREETGLTATPVLLVNSHKLPHGYAVDDLVYIADSL